MASPTAQCLKRLQIELHQLAKEKDTAFQIGADPQNMLRCYFVMDGPEDTPYAGGRYVGLLEIPPDYPFKPPTVQMCTPSGRFKTGMAICLSNSSYHPEQWSPMWGLRTILIALVSFFVSNEPTTGSIDSSEADRRRYAANSRQYNVERITTVYKRVLPEAFAKDVLFLETKKQRARVDAVDPLTQESLSGSESDSSANVVSAAYLPSKMAKKEQSSTETNGNTSSESCDKASQQKDDANEKAGEKAAAGKADSDTAPIVSEGDDAVPEGKTSSTAAHKRHHRDHKSVREPATMEVANVDDTPWRRWISMAVVVAVGLVLLEQLRWCFGPT